MHGEGLELLDLAGCRRLDNVLMVEYIRQRCKRLVVLDLSGPFGEGTGRPSFCANARWPILDSGTLGGWDPVRKAGDGTTALFHVSVPVNVV